jgi:hypothetical protein
MKNYQNYKRGYFMPPVECTDWVKKEYIDKAPACFIVLYAFSIHICSFQLN